MTTENIKNFSDIMLFDNLKNSAFDLYCYPGHPRDIHDKYGALAVIEFYDMIIGSLEKYADEVYRAGTCIFAVPHSGDNPEYLHISYKSKVYRLTKRTVTIDNML